MQFKEFIVVCMFLYRQEGCFELKKPILSMFIGGYK